MNKLLIICSLLTACFQGVFAFDLKNEQYNSICFKENKGQVNDQFYKPRPDVLFSGMANGLAYHLKKDGISYQLFRVDGWKEEAEHNAISFNKKTRKIPEALTAYRLDINWINCNKNAAVKKGDPLSGYENFYLAGCPDGVTKVRSYEDVTYNNIYKGIDLHYYSKDGNLKYDYIVQPNTDHKQIKLRINGAETIRVNAKGELIIKTPLGEIIEHAPLVKQNDKILPAQWRIKNNIVSFEIENIDPAFPLVIDPAVRVWGTYFGGNNLEDGPGGGIDKAGNLYLTGETSTSTASLIVTSGSHQTTFGGGTTDTYIAKFNGNGQRIWSTFYGGNNFDLSNSLAVDTINNFIYVVGETQSSTGISTPGSHQASNGGGYDGYLVKFDTSGVRIWGTFYGGVNFDGLGSCVVDIFGNVYVGGQTDSPFVIATSGSHQTTMGGNTDAFLVKFNSNGVRQWGTYYGGNMGDAGGCVTDKSGNVYLKGSTSSTANISTPGAYQSSFGGNTSDGFIAKFNPAGVRQWATYFGSTGNEGIGGANCDAMGNLIISGTTSSTIGLIALPTHQSAPGGLDDVYIAKFSPSGSLLWSSYYGGSNLETGGGVFGDIYGNIYMGGSTYSNASISTPGSHQPVLIGGTNGMLIKFDYNGTRLWGTYYGGGNEDVLVIYSDNKGSLYFNGTASTTSGTAVATPGTYQPAWGGGRDGYLAKFYECPTVNIAASSKTICVGNAALLTAMGVGTFTWDTGPNTNTISVTPTINTTYTVTHNTGTCVSTNTIDITVIPGPIVSVTGNTSVCQGKTTTLTATGATTYSWSTGVTTNTASLGPINTNTNYIVVGSSPGCINSTTLTVPVNMNPTPTINVSSTSTLICRYTNATLTASGANTYTWLATAVGSTAQVSPFVTSTFTVNGIDVNGCLGTNTISIAVMTNSLMNVTSTKTVLCLGDSTLFNATGANTYTWSTGPVSPTVMITPTVTGTSSYSVNGTDGNGCVAPKFFNVLVYSNPTVTAVSSTSMICVNQSATLTANGANTYSWNTSASGSLIVVSPTVTTTYTVTGIDLNGCYKNAVITQSVSTCIGINEFQVDNEQMNIFPNPTNGEFTITIGSNPQNMALEIYNAVGQMIKQEELKAPDTKMNLSEHPDGIYFLRLTQSDQSIRIFRIIKQ